MNYQQQIEAKVALDQQDNKIEYVGKFIDYEPITIFKPDGTKLEIDRFIIMNEFSKDSDGESLGFATKNISLLISELEELKSLLEKNEKETI